MIFPISRPLTSWHLQGPLLPQQPLAHGLESRQLWKGSLFQRGSCNGLGRSLRGSYKSVLIDLQSGAGTESWMEKHCKAGYLVEFGQWDLWVIAYQKVRSHHDGSWSARLSPEPLNLSVSSLCSSIHAKGLKVTDATTHQWQNYLTYSATRFQ